MTREIARAAMVELQIARRGVRDERVLQAFHDVPREEFVGADLAEVAYDDSPLPIGQGQTISALANHAAARLARLGVSNVTVLCGDGSVGAPEQAPFDAIVVAAGGPRIPPALFAQLAQGARLVMPIGPTLEEQELVCITRDGTEHRRESLGHVRFVPLVGEQGWAQACG